MKLLPASNEWHLTHTDLSRYLVTRLYQLVDTSEVISYRYPMTNGMILVEELYDTATSCIQRPKTKDRLKSLLDECCNIDIQTSIVNDLIINDYFRQIISDIQDLKKLDVAKEEDVKRIQIKSLIHLSTLQLKYIYYLQLRLKRIDLKSSKFITESNTIDSLLKILVSHALHTGHSLSHLKVSFADLIGNDLGTLIDMIFQVFSFPENRLYKYFIACNSPLIKDIVANLDYEYKDSFPSSSPFQNAYIFSCNGKDAFSTLRNTVVNEFKKLSTKSSKIDSQGLDEIWNNTFSENRQSLSKLNFKLDGDPMIPSARINTLEESLKIYNKSLLNINDDILDCFADSLYLYHLALNFPSLENSYMLLWTVLESLMGLRTNEADIITIKKNVTDTIALGSIGRRVIATVGRMKGSSESNSLYVNYIPLGNSSANEYDEDGLCHWIEWISEQNLEDTDNDPYNYLKNEPLLCKQYCHINKNWKTLEGILKDIEKAKVNLEYQIDRLYQTRNKIVHSGKFGKTGSYLWVHLEYYVAKILAVSILILSDIPKDLNADPRDIVFGCLRGQYESSIDYLRRHKQKPVKYVYILESGITRFPVLCF